MVHKKTGREQKSLMYGTEPKVLIIMVITFYLPSCPGQDTATFWSSSQAATCPPHMVEVSHCPLIAEPIFMVFGLTRPGIELESTVSVADAPSTRPLIGQKN